jgi:hypothetical protein
MVKQVPQEVSFRHFSKQSFRENMRQTEQNISETWDKTRRAQQTQPISAEDATWVVENGSTMDS